MANELTITLSAAYENAKGRTGVVEVANLEITQATAQLHDTEQLIGFSAAEAIGLGDVASLGILILENLNTTYHINIYHATSGTLIAKLFPKGSAAGLNFCILQIGSGITAPFAQAATAECWMRVFLLAL